MKEMITTTNDKHLHNCVCDIIVIIVKTTKNVIKKTPQKVLILVDNNDILIPSSSFFTLKNTPVTVLKHNRLNNKLDS